MRLSLSLVWCVFLFGLVDDLNENTLVDTQMVKIQKKITLLGKNNKKKNKRNIR